MNIDERLDRLVERHEALAQSVELLVANSEEQRKSIEASRKTIEEQGISQGNNIDRLLHLIEIDAENIRSLARIAESHEHRINGLEDSTS